MPFMNGEVETGAPVLLVCRDGGREKIGFKKEDQRRGNALGVEGKRYTKAKRAESSRCDKGNTGQLRAAASKHTETGGRLQEERLCTAFTRFAFSNTH